MIRTVIADSNALVRHAVARLLSDMNQVQVVGQASCGDGVLQLVRELHPDVVILDVVMPGLGGLETTARITAQSRMTGVIALTDHTTAPLPAQMLKAGALGFLSKNVEPTELEAAVRRVFMGKRYVCHEVAQDLASYAVHDNGASPFENLSHREMQIMMMVVGCQRVNEISLHLHLSPKTVNSYRYRIFDKLNVRSDVELVLLAVRHGLVSNELEPLRADRKSAATDEHFEASVLRAG